MNNNQQFILALIFIIAFSIISGFVFIHGAMNDTSIWKIYQPYFEKLLYIVSGTIGYYARVFIAGKTVVKED
jgi:hypothetical protein